MHISLLRIEHHVKMHISEWDGAIGGRGKEKARRSTNIQNWHENVESVQNRVAAH